MKENELSERMNEIRQCVKVIGAGKVILSLIEEVDKIAAKRELLNESIRQLVQEEQDQLRLIDTVFEEAKENGSVRCAIGQHTYHIQFVAEDTLYDTQQCCLYNAINCRITIGREPINPIQS